MKTFNAALLFAMIFLMVGCSGTPTRLSEQSSLSPTILPSMVQPTTTSLVLATETLPDSYSPAQTDFPGITTTPEELSTPEMTESAGLVLPTLPSDPEAWKNLPVIPQISQRVIEIYKTGLTLGNDPHRFSKIGDCGSTPTWFLGDFDRGERYYKLGEYTGLKSVIHYYAGSFERLSLAAQSGFNVSSVLTPIWADKSQCLSNETPLACEYRLHKPILAFITLGTNDVFHQESFEAQMRKIIEYSIENGIVPVLSTKADNIEETQYINITISKLAMEYQGPLWNFWLAVQTLPDKGLQEDGAHITWGSNHYDDPLVLQKGWAVRNLTALQVLDAIWQQTHSITVP
jgi:hypothetical protein